METEIHLPSRTNKVTDHGRVPYIEQAPHSTLVNIVCADVHSNDAIALDIKNHTQVTLNLHRINGGPIKGRQLVDFVRPQARIERIFLKNFQARRVASF